MKHNPKFRATHILLMAFIALLFYFVFLNTGTSKHTDNMLLKFFLSDVTGFAIINDRARQIFTRNGNEWQAQGFPNLKLSKIDIDSFLDDVRNIEFSRNIKETNDLLPFGLEQTNLLISVFTPMKTWTIVLGAKSLSGKQFYTLSDRHVFLIPGKFEPLFHKNLFTFRSKSFFNINTDQITKIDVGYLGRRAVLEKIGPQWELSYPFRQPVPNEIVNTLLFELEDLKVTEFIEGGTIDLGYYNLPSYDQIILSSALGIRSKIMFGKQMGNGIAAARNDDTSSLTLVDPYLAETGLTNFLSAILTKKNQITATGANPSTEEHRSNK